MTEDDNEALLDSDSTEFHPLRLSLSLSLFKTIYSLQISTAESGIVTNDLSDLPSRGAIKSNAM